MNTHFLNQSLPVNGPRIICGLPRTGTTLIYNLLDCDTNCRAPFYTDMRVSSVPPVSRSNLVEQKQRVLAAQSAKQLRNKLLGQTNATDASHQIFIIEEDFDIMEQIGINITLTIMTSQNQIELDAWNYN